MNLVWSIERAQCLQQIRNSLAQANLAEASATIGTTGTGDQDQTVRFGVSEGMGYAGRVHWGDADKDGNPEYGVGADFGPVSFDVKTEDPLRTAFQNSGGPLTQAASELYDGNMTNDAMAAAADAGSFVGGVIDAAAEGLLTHHREERSTS